MNAITRTAPPGPFLQLHSGACISLTRQDFSAVPLSDIAIALSRTARFRGATRGDHALSVAQHSVFVSQLLAEQRHSQAIQRAGLLHDAHEAVIGDIPTPIKVWLGRDWLAALERPLITAIYARFGLAISLADAWQVKQADELAFATERRDLLAEASWPWPSPCDPSPFHQVKPWPASDAYAAFMAQAFALGLG